MDVSTNASGGVYATPDVFVGTSATQDFSPAVASLDCSSVQQTKSEIRSLAAEIAQLTQTTLEPAGFYDGFLPRLCAAMGAKAAAVWQFRSDSQLVLAAGHALPSALLAVPSYAGQRSEELGEPALSRRPDSASAAAQPTLPSPSHERILKCVIAEGQPILVPPSSVKVEAERPHNPLSDSLILVPVRVQDDVEFLLEVVQRPSGGPAAQRGYLRFVAQMADLMADFLRRHQLRQLNSERQRLTQVERWLTAIAATPRENERRQLAADAVRDLFAADRCVLLSGMRRCRVVAISGARSFDPRSEIVLSAEALQQQLLRDDQLYDSCAGADGGRWIPLWLKASDRRTESADAMGRNLQAHAQTSAHTAGLSAIKLDPTLGSVSNRLPSPPTGRGNPIANRRDTLIDSFCQGLACRQAVVLPLDKYGMQWAILAYAEQSVEPPIASLSDSDSQTLRWAYAIGGLLQEAGVARGLVGWLATALLGEQWTRRMLKSTLGGSKMCVLHDPRARRSSTLRAQATTWILRMATIALLAAVAFFPVSQQISATAILQPRNKQMYYAPAAAIVTEVMVDEGDEVKAGTPLLKLMSHDLVTQVESYQIELTKTQGELEEKTSRLNRGDDLSTSERDQLEFNLRELDTTLRSLQLQLKDAQQREQELTITARSDGKIATWDLKNRLLNHPVQAGQLLASSFDPNDQWRLLLSIPDHRAGLVATAMDRSAQGAVKVHFSLASHPDRVLEAFAVDMAPQVTVHGSDPNSSARRVVNTGAIIRDSGELPLKSDGAIARATVDCGPVPLCWLIFRDAAWAISSRIRMLW